MNSDFIKGVNKAIDAATGVIGGDYTYKYHTDVTRALDRLADVIAGAAAAGMHFEVYDELPATGESNVIYLIPRESTETGNIYDEYIWTENEGFEKIGSTDVDLSGYVTTDDLATALNGYVAKETGKGLSTNDFTDALLTKLNGISAGAEANVQSDWNESDSSSDAYIANKPDLSEKLPSYTLGESTTIVDTTTVSFSKDGDNDWYVSGRNPITITGGVSALRKYDCLYEITWDSDKYLLFSHGFCDHGLKRNYNYKINGLTVWTGIGNVVPLGYSSVSEDANNIPFAITVQYYGGYFDSDVYIISYDTNVSHTISIKKIPITTKNIDLAFLIPDKYRNRGDFLIRQGIKNSSGQTSIILNEGSQATGRASLAEGGATYATGDYSHAEGMCTIASGSISHAEGGYGTTASGSYAHAENYGTTASGAIAHAEGALTTASAQAAHAEGGTTIASGTYAHAEGVTTIANHKAQHAGGRFNVADPSQAAATEYGTYAEIIGNGYSEKVDGQTVEHRSNARTLDWDGNEVLSGTIEASGFGPTLAAIVAGGGGNANCVTLTQAQYNDLSQAEKNNGTYYYISDADVDSSSTGLIDDTSTPSADRVWSSEKTAQEIASAVGVTIDDTTTDVDKVWSSDKTNTEITGLQTFISDNHWMTVNLYSPSGTYEVGDIVYFTGGSLARRYYRCITAIPTAHSWDVNEWEAITTEEIIQNYIARPFERRNVNYPVYPVGSYVIYKGNLWKCTTATDGSKDFDSSEWEIANVTDRLVEDNDFIFTPTAAIENDITVNKFKMRIKDNILYLVFDFAFTGTYFTSGVVGKITRTDSTEMIDSITLSNASISPFVTMVNRQNVSTGPFEGVESRILPSFTVPGGECAWIDLDLNYANTASAAGIGRVMGNLVYPLG